MRTSETVGLGQETGPEGGSLKLCRDRMMTEELLAWALKLGPTCLLSHFFPDCPGPSHSNPDIQFSRRPG